MEFELTKAQAELRDLVHWIAATRVRRLSLDAEERGRVPDELLLELQAIGIRSGRISAHDVGMHLASEGDAEVAQRAPGRQDTPRRASDVGDPRAPLHDPTQASRTAVIATEELAWGDGAVVLSLPGPGLAGPIVRGLATPEQKRRLLLPFTKEKELHWGAYALTEREAGSDVGALRTTAVKDGDRYVLNGRKCYITNGARADWVIVFATVDPGRGRAAQRAFIVPRGTRGLSVEHLDAKVGLRAVETAALRLEDVSVPAEDLLGGEGAYDEARGGIAASLGAIDVARPIVAAMAVGVARAALERVAEVAKQAYMLSRPLPRHAVIRALLGRMERRLHAARLLVWKAAALADQRVPNSLEASMAKAYAAAAARAITSDALEVLGAGDHRRDALVEKWFRDAKVYDIVEGTGDVQRIVIAKRVLESTRSR